MMTVRRDNLQFHDPDSALAEAARVERERERTDRMLSKANESAPGKRQWFVLSVHIHNELAVERRLKQKNIDAWVPWKKGRVRNRPNGRVVIFTGFVFVNIPYSLDAFHGLRGIKSVRGVMGTEGGRPLPIRAESEKQLNGLLRRHMFDGGAAAAAVDIVAGKTKVEITDGHFACRQAIVKSVRGRDFMSCVAVLVDCGIPVNIPLDKVVIVD